MLPNPPPDHEFAVGERAFSLQVHNHLSHPVSDLSRDVGVLQLFPGITAAVVSSFLASNLKGVVLKTFGSGKWTVEDGGIVS